VSGLSDVDVSAFVAAGALPSLVTFNKSLFTGNAFSYSWWVVCFQAAGLALAAAVSAGGASKASAAQGFLTVLTMTTFLFTSDVLNAPLGAYAWCVARDWAAGLRMRAR
jgi:hypothetical protein